MTWTYVNSGNSTRDKVRFLCGDTNILNQLIQDEDIDAILLDYSNPFMAAAEACDAIAAKLSFDTDTSNSGLSVAGSKRAIAFKTLSKDLRKKAGRSISIFSGGRTKSEAEDSRADDSIKQPAFETGMHDIDVDTNELISDD